MSDSVDVVLPRLNEAARLPWPLSQIPAGYRLIVADNGSTGGPADVAAAGGALVVAAPRHGFGAASHGGLEAATASVVCFADADGSFDPAQLTRVVDPLCRTAPAGAWASVDYAPRAEGGQSKVTGTVRGTVRTVLDVSRVLSG